MKVLLTGGTGFIGSNLASALRARGDAVTIPTRSPASAEVPEGAEPVRWDLDSSSWYGIVDGKDAVVHLAGEQAIGVRWTEEVKKRLVDSRVRSTERIVEAMWRSKMRPKVFVCGSAVGYYGARGNGPVDEAGQAGGDFLATLCKQWERAANKARDLGIRVVNIRMGVVFGRGGGALEEMAKPFKLFVGGPIGTGRQVVSWVHMDDAVGIVLRILDDPSIEGPVNVTAPNPVTNADLSKQIGEALHRPSFFRVPEGALRLRFGEGAEPLVTGQRVLPRAMERAGYTWRYPEVRPALEEVFG